MFSRSIRSCARRSAPSLQWLPLQARLTHSLRSLPHPCCRNPQFRRCMSTPVPPINDRSALSTSLLDNLSLFHLTYSHLSLEKYHAKADHAMEELLDKLEGLLDSVGLPDWEVDYHVCRTIPLFLTLVDPSNRVAYLHLSWARMVLMSLTSNLQTSRFGYPLLGGVRHSSTYLCNAYRFTLQWAKAIRLP